MGVPNSANRSILSLLILWSIFPVISVGQEIERDSKNQLADTPFKSGVFGWSVSKPMIEVDLKLLPEVPGKKWIAIKDPSVVRFDNRWHLFCTLRNDSSGEGRIRIGYCSFSEWEEAHKSKWHLLELTNDYHGAPQIFFFEPHRKWYLIYQAADKERGVRYGPCFSTNDAIDRPEAWTAPRPIYEVPEGANAGLDFWCICDKENAYLFHTTLNGLMWRSSTKLEDFPDKNWSKPEIALKGDIFEASHTYFVEEEKRYLTMVEAQGDGRRYFKAYVAENLNGDWSELAASKDKPFVSPRNVLNQEESWATSYSHGEILRLGINQELRISSRKIQILFQGASDREYQIGSYGQIPWRLGKLSLNESAVENE